MASKTDITTRLRDVMQADRHRIRRLWRQAEKADDKRSGELEQEIESRIKDSHQKCENRRAAVPKINLPSELPITEHAESIVEMIQNHRVLVLCGETGSGKSTQLPKLCLQAGRGIHGLIGHTQPRRLAARSLSSRIADELAVPLGSTVGFKIRFTDQTAPNTLIKLMTDGILLAETQSDRFLDHYDTLIIDEAHERSLNIDFLLGYLRRLLDQRPDLRIILTSATLDAEKFAKHFELQGKAAPIIQVSGRTYPVEVRYRPLMEEEISDDSNRPERDLLSAISDAVVELQSEGSGDILTFLPT
ncbi:MAG: AAA family ATPase, partial [Planctomycetota bacterium]|nr:AAA family ATPase [Planctomycetota bacterium]